MEGPSHEHSRRTPPIVQSIDDDDDDDDEEVCCQCHLFSPSGLKFCPNLTIVDWAHCDRPLCGHWVHLQYCVPIHEVSSDDTFICPCCASK